MQCKTRTERTKAESNFGCRYSVLLDLPYFDPVRMLIIDPMHNLFLGSAKYFTQNILVNNAFLDNHKLEIIQKRLSSISVPFDIGRLPNNIASRSTFTAHQWMNWTLYLSVFCLHGLLPQTHIECWRSFVLACRRLCKKSLTDNDITVADLLLMQFCKRIHALFGHKFVTPNMHLHNHLASCIRDFGPLHAFWLYSFERYNGLLGNLPTNNHAVEIQLMQRFVRDNTTLDLISQAESIDLVEEFGEVVLGHAKRFYSVAEHDFVNEKSFSFPPKHVLTHLDMSCCEELKRLYSTIYPLCSEFLATSKNFPSICCKYEYVLINNKKLASSKKNAPSYAMAKPVAPFPSCSNISTNDGSRPIEIQYFIKHTLQVPQPPTATNPPGHETHVFVIGKWLMYHPEHRCMGKPVQVWCKSLYEPVMNTVIPLKNLTAHVISAVECIAGESVLVVIPFCE